METRKETLTAIKLCRFCLSQDETLTSLYDRNRAPKNVVSLPLKILSCVSIEVFPSDKMPSYICNRCKFFMDVSYEYKQMCRQADENILQYIQNGTDLTSVPWPSSLQKLFRAAEKSAPELAIMKTVVEGGATVQVTAQGSDSEEDDDENVYNIKIGDGSDEGPKNARVKVITANKGKPKQGKDTEDEGDTQELAGGTPQPSSAQCAVSNQEPSVEDAQVTDLRDGRWSCDQCDCTYPLLQLLNLHKDHKHRERNVQCDQCDAKFYNNSDLATHQLRHSSDEFIFQCVACGKKFKRLILLKRHEKLIHADLAQLPCPSCPATFLSQEELEAHNNEKHALSKERRFACDVCDKRFHEKSTLLRHKVNVHDKESAYACVYCPARFPAVSKLTRHVRAHAGERSYPCKYCNKSFIKSHHYTRHLRIKHRETIRTARGPFGESIDQYRCEQCEDTFATQDELIYHSAIHATQNLTCPLCQEKFDDVDGVTSHIKSHLNGTEFMCDLCELVFTSKEKLDQHFTNAHDDELRDEMAQDESSMEMDVEDEEDEAAINVKEEDGHMVVEIKKADDFMLTKLKGAAEDKLDNTNSEDSEQEITYTELSTVDTLAIPRKEPAKPVVEKPIAATPGGAIITKTIGALVKPAEKSDGQTAPILRKAEEIKRKVQPAPEPVPQKKKTETNNTGANDKSLRLLEKDLQELKRTNTRTELVKTPVKPMESLRNRRPQIHTSTPKLRTAPIEEKKAQVSTKSPALEKKQPEKRVVTKENKEPKDAKETKANNGNGKEEKEVKEKETKEKETPKSAIKNGANEKTVAVAEEGIRRSTRPSKIKDYAKMIRDRTQDSDDDDNSDDGEEEYKETDKSIESKSKSRRGSIKSSPKPAPAAAATTPAPAPRKRGRPRKDAGIAPTPPKVPKEDDMPAVKTEEKEKESENDIKPKEIASPAEKTKEKITSESGNSDKESNAASETKPDPKLLVSPTGQTWKKIPIKALPPGVKPLPLPVNARPISGTDFCEMQLGEKTVRVQRVVMTKAEVEAMAKKGLVTVKDGTMILKPGTKLPTADPAALKTLVADEKESPIKKEKVTPAPTRCNIDEET